MTYKELEKLAEEFGNKCKVCLFGAGLVGRTWGYDLISTAGFHIDFYCDNNILSGTKIRNGVKNIIPEELYNEKDVLVFITVTDKYQSAIEKQLRSNGVDQIINADYAFMQHIIESILDSKDDEIVSKYAAVVDDVEYISRQFEYYMGYRPDLVNPKTFNEKLQWLKLHDRNQDYVKMVDKYEVKKFITDKIGGQYIIPTLGIYNSFDEIDFEELPKQFVLKCTHDSGSTVICIDKDKFDKEYARNILQSGMKRNFYWVGREWAYKNVKPRIIVEKYMVDESGCELKDYKFFCFNGQVEALYVACDRLDNSVDTKFDFYDMEFRHLPFENGHPNAKREIKKPIGFDVMKAIAEQLSSGVPHMRVDFYDIKGTVYFGEITFSHMGGFFPFRPDIWDKKFGSWLTLPELKSGMSY